MRWVDESNTNAQFLSHCSPSTQVTAHAKAPQGGQINLHYQATRLAYESCLYISRSAALHRLSETRSGLGTPIPLGLEQTTQTLAMQTLAAGASGCVPWILLEPRWRIEERRLDRTALR